MAGDRIYELTDHVRITVKWEDDYDCDGDTLGTYTDIRDDFRIDRKDGVFLGEYQQLPDFEVKLADIQPGLRYKAGQEVGRSTEYKGQWQLIEWPYPIHYDWAQILNRFPHQWFRIEEKTRFVRGRYNEVDEVKYFSITAKEDIYHEVAYEDGEPTSFADDEARRLLLKMIQDAGFWIEEDDDSFYAQYDEFEKVYTPSFYGAYKVLAKDLGRTCHDTSRELRYFEPEAFSPSDYEHPDNVQAALSDWQRAEELNDGYWGYVGCVVTVEVDDVEVGEASLWCIESDADDEHYNEVIKDLIDEALKLAKSGTGPLIEALGTLPAIDIEDYDFA